MNEDPKTVQDGTGALAGELLARLRFASVPAIIVFSLAPYGKWGLIAGSLVLLVTVVMILGGLKVALRGGPDHKTRTQRGAILEWSLYAFLLLTAHGGAWIYRLIAT